MAENQMHPQPPKIFKHHITEGEWSLFFIFSAKARRSLTIRLTFDDGEFAARPVPSNQRFTKQTLTGIHAMQQSIFFS